MTGSSFPSGVGACILSLISALMHGNGLVCYLSLQAKPAFDSGAAYCLVNMAAGAHRSYPIRATPALDIQTLEESNFIPSFPHDARLPGHSLQNHIQMTLLDI